MYITLLYISQVNGSQIFFIIHNLMLSKLIIAHKSVQILAIFSIKIETDSKVETRDASDVEKKRETSRDQSILYGRVSYRWVILFYIGILNLMY